MNDSRKAPDQVILVSIIAITAGFIFFKIAVWDRFFARPAGGKTVTASIYGEAPVMTGFQLTAYDSGKKSMLIRADKLYVRNRKINPLGFRIALGKSAELEEVDATFFKDNKPVACLHSKTAVMDKKRSNILFKGRPFLLTGSQRSLKAREIFWDNSESKLFAKGNCALGIDKTVHKGATVTTDVELRDFQVTSE